MRWMQAQGVSTGYADGDYHPADPVTQAVANVLNDYDGIQYA